MNTENENNEEISIVPAEKNDLWLVKEKAQIDLAVSTAKAYPRDIKKALDNSIITATMDIETASTCGYAVPRAGKTITGKSVHLANIVMQFWGNLRVETKVIGIHEKHIESEAVAWDLESNLAVKVTVKRPIMQNKGKDRMSEDMITVTGNAANSIAKRNAVFSVIPTVITDKVYQAAQNKIIGGDEAEIQKRLLLVLKAFKKNHNKDEADVLALVGKKTRDEITKDNLVVLIWVGNSIKDGDTTVEEAFKKTKKEELEDAKNKMRKNQVSSTIPKEEANVNASGQGEMFDAKKEMM